MKILSGTSNLRLSKDISKIPDCIVHYNNEYQTARKECGIWGNLEKASAALPGIVEHRFQQLQEIEAILEYLNIEKRKLSDIVEFTKGSAFDTFVVNPIALTRHDYI